MPYDDAMIEHTLEALGFGAEEVRLYLHLWQKGPATAGRIAQRCGLRRSSLYGMLDRLVAKGVVTCEEPGGVRRFHAVAPGVFQDMFARRQQELAEAQTQFHQLLPRLYQATKPGGAEPRLTLYRGKDQLQNVIGDMLLYDTIETFAFWPIRTMVEILGSDYFRQHNIARIKRGISVKAIWPEKQIIDQSTHPWLGSGTGFLREIRLAPPSVDATMGYWIYGAQVAVLSSAQECFGFVLESVEFAALMRVQHDILWSQSRPLACDAPETAAFAAKHGPVPPKA